MHSVDDISNAEKKLKQPRAAYLFDVDGVLTDPEAKKITEPEIFNQLIKRLQNCEPVGLNTGRSLNFIAQEVLDQLETRVTDKALLKNLYAIGEKGAAWIIYNQENHRIVHIDQKVSVPEEIQQQVRQLVAEPQFSKTMFYDETKRTMVTAELRHNKTILEFQKPQQQFAVRLLEILAKHSRGNEFKIDLTRIATDVESKSVGKALGARRFTKLLQKAGIEPQEYISFGDSASDYDMHKELQKLGKKAKFVFVGGKNHLEGKNLEGVVFTDQHVDKGTLKYLQHQGK